MRLAWARKRQRCAGVAAYDRLNGQTLAALGAASFDDGLTATGLHANTKAVSALATGDGRLKSAFHDGSGKKKRAGILGKPTISSNFRRLVKHLKALFMGSVKRPVDNYPADRVESRFTEVADNE